MEPLAGSIREILAVRFGRGGNLDAFPHAGWYGPEEGAHWTAGLESRITLRVAEDLPPGTLLLWSVRCFLGGGTIPQQRLLVAVNGQPIAADALRHPTTRAGLMPAAIKAATPVEIRFSHPDAASPHIVSAATDRRMLAVAFRSIRVLAPAAMAERRVHWGCAQPMPADGELLNGFESLGFNCEFGLVQRSVGAEPLGLLRFSSIQIGPLIEGLQRGFDDLADPAQLRIAPHGTGASREFLIYHRVYHLAQHTRVREGDPAVETLHESGLRHLAVLRRLLLGRLQDGRTIFVCKGRTETAESEVLALFAALNDYGPNRLLWVMAADAAHPAGSLREVTPGLLRASISRFAPNEDAYRFDKPSWLAACRAAYAHWCGGLHTSS